MQKQQEKIMDNTEEAVSWGIGGRIIPSDMKEWSNTATSVN